MTGRRKSAELVDLMGADEVAWREDGHWGRLLIGGVTIAGVGPSTRDAEPFVRVQLRIAQAELPKALLRGLEVKPRGKDKDAEKETNVYVRTEAQARKIGPILRRVAQARAKS